MHKTTSGSSEPHAPVYKTGEGRRMNQGPVREDERSKLKPTAASQAAAQKEGHIASVRDNHDDLNELSEENLAEYTSMLVAVMRAAESKRDDALVHDPYAELLAGDAGGAFLSLCSKWSSHMDTMSEYIALRTRSVDEALLHRDPTIQQIVILGAGLDSRAYRMQSLSDCLVLEVDASKSMMEHKKQILKDADARVLAKQHHVVIADLEQDMWQTELIAKGFNPKQPTFWLMEGLLYYLAYDSNVRLVKTVDAISAPRSQLWADVGGFALVKRDLNDAREGIFRTRALKYGENDPHRGVLAMLEWQMEIQASLDQPCELHAREWKPMTVPSNDEDREEEVVPWFFVMATKPQEKRSHQLL